MQSHRLSQGSYAEDIGNQNLDLGCEKLWKKNKSKLRVLNLLWDLGKKVDDFILDLFEFRFCSGGPLVQAMGPLSPKFRALGGYPVCLCRNTTMMKDLQAKQQHKGHLKGEFQQKGHQIWKEKKNIKIASVRLP